MKKILEYLAALIALTVLLTGCDEEVRKIESAAQLNDPQYTIGYEEGCDSALKDVPPRFRKLHLKYNSIADMNKNENLVLGMQTGFVFVDKETRRMLPKAEIKYYKSTPDMAYMVANGKLDGFINDEPVIRYAALENPNLAYIHADFEPMDIVIVFPKNEKAKALRDEMDEFIDKMHLLGMLDSIDNIWLGEDEDKKVVEFPKAKPGMPTYKMATSAVNPPFEYIKNGEIVGYEMDLIARFCKDKGCGLEVHDVAFESVILGIETGMYDFAAATLSATPIFKEKNYLSHPIYVSECVMAVQILDGKAKQQVAKNPEDMIKSLNRDGAKIGLITGGVFDKVLNEFFPTAKSLFFNTYADMVKSIDAGKLDAMLVDEPTARLLVEGRKEVEIVNKILEKANYAFAFSKSEKGEKLCAQMTEFIQNSIKQGLQTDLESVWFGSDESLKKIDLSKLKATNGTLHLATNTEVAPFVYIKDNASWTDLSSLKIKFYDANGQITVTDSSVADGAYTPTQLDANDANADGSQWLRKEIPLSATSFRLSKDGYIKEYPIYEQGEQGSVKNFTKADMIYQTAAGNELELLYPKDVSNGNDYTETPAVGYEDGTDRFNDARGDYLYLRATAFTFLESNGKIKE